MSPDVFGDVIDADTIEQAAVTTLKAWLPSHLAHQERRRGLTSGTLPQPRSWPTVSDFEDIAVHIQLPAVVLVSPGTSGTPAHDGGAYRATWQLLAAIEIGGKNETEARRLAALYIAAVRGALAQNPTLGGVVESCRWIGAEDHAFGPGRGGGQRAIYGTAFEVTVRDVVNARLGPVDPPADPYNPVPIPPTQLEADIVITATPTDQEVETP